MPRLLVVLDRFAKAWMWLTAIIVGIGALGILFKEGFGALANTFSPYNFWNFLAIAILAAPGVLAQQWAARIRARTGVGAPTQAPRQIDRAFDSAAQESSATDRRLPTLVPLFLLAFFALGVWQACFQVTNEIGPVGMDKVGRQVFLQSFDAYAHRSIDSTSAGYSLAIGSEFSTVPLWRRLFQEPQRTTFRMSYHLLDTTRTLDSAIGTRFLESSADELMAQYQGPVTLQKDFDVPADSVMAHLHSLHVQTVRELLSAYGFRHFELLVDGRTLVADSLPIIGRNNAKWIGSD